MQRRRFLTAGGTTAILSLTGCLSDRSSPQAEDSDGDGVSDDADYAPRDPDVQSKSDLKTTARPTTTTAAPTTTTTTTATTTAPPPNRIEADYAPIQETAAAYFRWYSLEASELWFDADGFEPEELDDTMQFVVMAQEYPDGAVLDYATTPAKPIDTGANRLQIAHELAVSTRTPFYLNVFAIPRGTTFETAAETGSAVFFCETDRLRLVGDTLMKDPHPDALEPYRTREYERIAGEGVYTIQLSGAVTFGINIYKHAYIEANQAATQRPQAVIRDSYQTGVSSALASIVADAASDAGYTSGREQVNYAVTAIQSLPYVKDVVDDSYDAYNKYPIETLVEAGGDCEDTVILLGASLLADPYGYGMILIYLPSENPDHVALGIKGSEDVVGSYYEYEGNRYFYTETTGEGWEIGEIPAEYEDETARLVPI